MTKRSATLAEPTPWKLLLWTAVAGLVFGLIGFGEIAEDYLRIARNSFHRHSAGGQIVVVRIDDPSLKEYGNWPWRRTLDAQLVDRLSAAGVKQIFFDISFYYPSDPAGDRAFASALERSGRVTIPTSYKAGPDAGRTLHSGPLPMFTDHARVATLSVNYNYQNAVWRLPFAVEMAGNRVPSMAAAIAGSDRRDGQFRVDYSIDLDSVPKLSAGDVLSGRTRSDALLGKTVLIGTDSDVIGDRYFIPGYGRVGGVFVHAMGAETLIEGTPVDLGWLPSFLAALAAVAIALTGRTMARRIVALGGCTIALLTIPAFSEARLMFVDVAPGLFVLLVASSVLGWRRYRARGWVNAVSNLPDSCAAR